MFTNIIELEKIISSHAKRFLDLDGISAKMGEVSSEDEKDEIFDNYQGVGSALMDVSANIIPFEDGVISIEDLITRLNALVGWMDGAPYGYTTEVWLEALIIVRDVLDKFHPRTLFEVIWVPVH